MFRHWQVDRMGRVGTASIPKRPSVRTKAASFNQLASRSRLLKLFWHPCVVAIWPDILHCILPQICGIIAFPLKVFTKKCWCWKGRFVFVHSNIQAVKWLSTKRWLLWPAALLLCCRFGLCSSPQLAVFRTLRSLTRFKSPSSTSLGPVFCCSMQQNKIKVTCIYNLHLSVILVLISNVCWMSE